MKPAMSPIAIRNWWDGLPSGQRAKLWKGGIISGALIVFLISYYVTGQDKDKPTATAKPEAQMTSIKLGDQLLEDDIKSSIVKAREEEELRNKSQDEKIQALAELSRLLQEQKEGLKNSPVLPLGVESEEKNNVASTPTIPDTAPLVPAINQIPPQIRFPPPPSGDLGNIRDSEPKESLIGGITHVEGDEKPLTEEPTTKKKRIVYLPPSMMEAMLLTGLDASTVDGAKDQPQPLLLRVQAPAVLPNHVKADLKGCFIIAHGAGSLASERVDARLVSLSCISHDGEAVIDQPIKGYLADADGKQGLKGIVVSRAGSHVARVFMAGMFGGMGEAIQGSSNTISVSPLGATQTLDPKKITNAGIGGGLKDAAQDIRKLFLDLARQASPVIEVGATKKVGVIVTEGVGLEIKDYGIKED